ncbi:hypothetical protein [Streptomyces koyangensis]
MDPEDVTDWDHWLDYLLDGTSVQLVRPSDTDRPTWAAYEEARYLGTVHSRFELDGRWHVQSLNERHRSLDDALRALRRPEGWTADREHVGRWARGILSDPHLRVLDVQTTGLDTAWAVQIGVTARDGNALFDELVNPLVDITPQATALHGLAPNQLSAAPHLQGLFARPRPPPSGPLLPGLQRGLRPSSLETRNPPPASASPLRLGDVATAQVGGRHGPLHGLERTVVAPTATSLSAAPTTPSPTASSC